MKVPSRRIQMKVHTLHGREGRPHVPVFGGKATRSRVRKEGHTFQGSEGRSNVSGFGRKATRTSSINASIL